MKIEGWLTLGHLPGAHFANASALGEFEGEARQYEQAIRNFEVDGCEAELWEALRNLGYDNAEIEWHVKHRGQRMQQGYIGA